MSKTDELRFERMLFEYDTTYQTDFRWAAFKHVEPAVYKPKAKKKVEESHYIPKDTQTVTPLKSKRIQFDLLWMPKEIIRTSPYAVQEPYDRLPDDGREEAQRTRPRLVMTPAVSVDDIADPRAREIICKDTYTTEWSRASKEAIPPMMNKPAKIIAPLGSHPTIANPIFIPQYNPPVVPTEWRRETIDWDSKQLRSFVNPDKEFWKKGDLY